MFVKIASRPDTEGQHIKSPGLKNPMARRVSKILNSTLSKRRMSTPATESILCNHLWPVIWLLRLFGNYPIVNNGYNISTPEPFTSSLTGVRALNFVTVYSLAITTLSIIDWALINLTLTLSLDLPFEVVKFNYNFTRTGFGSSLGEKLNETVMVAHVVLRVLLIVVLWAGAGSLARILNRWREFEIKFDETFQPIDLKFKPEFRTFQRVVLGGALALTLGGGPIFMVKFLFPMFLLPSALSYVLMVWQSIAVLVTIFIEDAKSLTMIKNLQLCYKQIRMGIKKEMEFSVLYPQAVAKWWELIHLNRRQAERVGDYLKGQELMVLVELIINTTCYTFSFIHLFATKGWSLREGNIVVMLTCVGFFGNYIGRYYLKILVAESYYSEEKKILNYLLEIQTKDAGVKNEVKLITDVLILSPSRINFGNYVQLEKSLILKVFGQIVTYLIVIFQFVNTPKSD